MTVELVPLAPEPDPGLGEQTALLADLILTFQAAAEARGAPSDEVRQGQISLLDAFGLLGDNRGWPLSDTGVLEPALPTDAELIKGFERFMKRRGMRPMTIRVRRNALDLASRQLPDGLVCATKGQIEAWLDRRTLSDQSRRCYMSHLKAFYTWAVDDEELPADPMRKIRQPRKRRYVPRPIPTRDLVRALEGADPTMRCWLLLGAYGGFRCVEIAGLDRGDVLEADGLLRITQGKGGHERVVPLHPEVLTALQALPMPSHGALFRRPVCRDRWPAGALSHTINDYLHSLGIESTAHTLRHWFGTTIYQLTHDIRLTQELMGHAGPNTTAIYTNSQELHLTGDEPPGRLVGRFRSEVIGSLGRAA